MFDISVIIVSFNTCDYLRDCLQSLYDDPGSPTLEVFVVDNGSVDNSVTMVQTEFPNVKVIETGENLGFARANNIALRQMQGRTALLLNSDTVVRPGALRTMLDVLASHPMAGGVGPRLLNRDGSLQRSCYRFPSPARAFRDQLFVTAALATHPKIGDFRRWSHDRERIVDFVIGAALLVRREVIESIGLLDENFFMYAEETDWCYRMKRADYSIVFTPDAEVVHYGGGSGKSMPDQVFAEFYAGQRRFYRKHYGVAGAVALQVSLVLGALLRIPIFSVIAIALPSKRNGASKVATLWKRILWWSLGIWRPKGIASQTLGMIHV
jgi:hypothetical protein